MSVVIGILLIIAALIMVVTVLLQSSESDGMGALSGSNNENVDTAVAGLLEEGSYALLMGNSSMTEDVACRFTVKATGAASGELNAAPQTKKELKEGYGMKGVSSIGKEWYEQAQALESNIRKPLPSYI